MASTSDIARRYFAAIDAQDLDAATVLWTPGAIDRLVGNQDLVAPDGIRAYFSALYGAFPDFRLTVIETTTGQGRCAVRWRATGTFAGPGSFHGLHPNGARLSLEGIDVVSVADDLIVHNDAYVDSGEMARQLGFLPAAGSAAEARMTRLGNAGTRLNALLRGASAPEPIADGVWIVRGGFPGRAMNVYLVRDGDGVLLFDAGISAMTASIAAGAAGLGGLTRVVLGHADCDHRGAAPGLGVPVYCHERERAAAESDSAFRDYWRLGELPRFARPLYGHLLSDWDGGAVTIAGTVAEGDEIAGFRVVELPGHAPGLIGLFREADGLALVSDCFYTINPVTSVKGAARIPHRAFNQDTAEAARSIVKLAGLGASACWPGHARPVTGDVRGQLEAAAAALP